MKIAKEVFWFFFAVILGIVIMWIAGDPALPPCPKHQTATYECKK